MIVWDQKLNVICFALIIVLIIEDRVYVIGCYNETPLLYIQSLSKTVKL